MESTVWDRDRPLLREIAHQIHAEGHGVDPRTVGAAIGMGHDAVDRAAGRLYDAGMLRAMRGDDRVVTVHELTTDGLRALGEWPANTDDMAQALLSALDDAATNARDDGERSKLQMVKRTLSGLSVNTVSGVAAMAVIKLMGWG